MNPFNARAVAFAIKTAAAAIAAMLLALWFNPATGLRLGLFPTDPVAATHNEAAP